MMLCPLNVVLKLSRFVNVTFSVNIGGGKGLVRTLKD